MRSKHIHHNSWSRHVNEFLFFNWQSRTIVRCGYFQSFISNFVKLFVAIKDLTFLNFLLFIIFLFRIFCSFSTTKIDSGAFLIIISYVETIACEWTLLLNQVYFNFALKVAHAHDKKLFLTQTFTHFFPYSQIPLNIFRPT